MTRKTRLPGVVLFVRVALPCDQVHGVAVLQFARLDAVHLEQLLVGAAPLTLALPHVATACRGADEKPKKINAGLVSVV